MRSTDFSLRAGADGASPELSLAGLTAVVAAVQHAVLIIDADGLIVTMNEAALALHGLARGDTIPSLRRYRELFDLLDLSGRPLSEDQLSIAAAMRGEPLRNLELRVRRRDTGREFVGLLGLAPLEGVPARSLSLLTIQDVTARRNTEDALHESEARLQLALEATAVGAFDHDLRTGVLVWSAATYRQFGVDPAEPIDVATFRSAIHPDDRAVVERAVRAATGGVDEGHYAVEFRINKREGGERWLSARGRVLLDEHRRPVRLIGVSLDVTERVEARRLRRASEALTRALFQLAPSGVVLLDRRGRFLEFNERACAQLGYSKEELARLSLAEIEAMETPEEARLHLERILAAGEDGYDTRHRARSGEVRDVHVNARRVELQDEPQILAVFEDITERKSVEAALRESEVRFRTLAENAPDPIFRYDRQLRYTYVNPAMVRLRRKTVENYLGRKNAELGFPPELVSLWEEAVERAFTTGAPQTTEFSFPTPAGERWYESTVVREEGPGGEARSVLGFTRDVTERVRAREAMREGEARFRTLAENAPDHIYRMDREGRFLYVNPALVRANGTTAAKILGRTTEELGLAPDVVAMKRAQLELALATRAPATCEFAFQSAQGPCQLESRLMPEIALDGEIRTLVGISRDVTERRRHEDELRASREQLRLLAGRLDAVREEEQSRIARDLHDVMGQLLTALKLRLERIEEAVDELPDDGPVRALLDRLVAATELADRAQAVVHQLATDLRSPVLDELGLGAALRFEARQLADHAGLSCEVRCPDEASSLTPERSTAAYRIIQEALTNVVRHAGAKRVLVSVEIADGRLVIRVEDDGCGIPISSTPEGLGIAGMRERADRLGGSLSLERTPAGGTCVLAQIPLAGIAG